LISATWRYAAIPASYAEARRSAIHAMLRVFAEDYSPSVQVTLYEMGKAALEVVPEATRIHLALPNKHYLPVNFAPFDGLIRMRSSLRPMNPTARSKRPSSVRNGRR
jgi:urate oxidase